MSLSADSLSTYGTSCQSQLFTYITYPSCNIPVSPECISIAPEIRGIQLDDKSSDIPTDATFSIFKKAHAKESAKIIDQLIFTSNFTEFLITAYMYRDRLPQLMFYYILSAAMIHHKSFKGAWIPHPFYVLPDHFFTDRKLAKIATELKEKQEEAERLDLVEEEKINEIPITNNKTHHSRTTYNNPKMLNLDPFPDDFKEVTTTSSGISNSAEDSAISRPYDIINKPQDTTTTAINESKTASKKNSTQKVRKINRHETGTTKDPEHHLWYFREDIAINSFHWHWHTVYPAQWIPKEGKPIKDRKGELFFHMHRQIIRRYNAERFAFNMTKVTPFDEWNDVIPEAYFPHLYSNVDEMEYPARPVNMMIRDVDTPDGIFITKDNLTEWTKKIKEAIKDGFAKKEDENETVPLNVENGTNILGAMLESSSQSPDETYYGILHNGGHVMLAQIHDPEGKYNTPLSVMGYTETSMRDPIFYRWHQFIDNIFQLQKDSLSPYTDEDLNWKDVIIKDTYVINEARTIKNELCTYHEKRTLDVSKGLDFSLINGSLLVEIDILNHDRFTYVIKVNNPTKRALEATVRIYLAPKNNDEGEEANDKELYNQFFEMDVFKVRIRPGLRIITRSSSKSSVTLSPEKTWMNLEADPSTTNFSEEFEAVCNCGWPDHLLVPRGTKSGMPFNMLVFITDYKKDKVDNSHINKTISSYHCVDGVRMCGVVGELFPDNRPMGFPFDRKIAINKRQPFSRQFLSRSNMYLSELKVFHLGNKEDLEKNETTTAKPDDEAEIDFS